MAHNLFILCLVNVETKESIGLEFCDDLDDLNFKRRMFLEDFGPDYVALIYPDSAQQLAEAIGDTFSTSKGT